MSVKPNPRAGVNAWQLAHVQVVFFPLDPSKRIQNQQQEQWFRDLTGSFPEQSVVKMHEAVFTGPFGETVLNLGHDLVKSTITIRPRTDEETLEFPVLMDAPEDAIDSILQLTSRWLGLAPPPIKRVGLNGRFIQKAKNLKAAYRRLKVYLPLLKIDANCTDLIYRINRPRKSRSAKLLLNRLTTWTALKRVQVRADLLAANDESVPKTLEEAFFCAFDFDMNTPADFIGELRAPRLKRIVRELADIALESAEKGDTR